MPASVPVRRLRVTAAAALVPLAALAGCAGLGQPQAYDQPGINGLVIPSASPDPDDFVDVVDNPWLPLEPGDTARYDVTEDGVDLGSIETAVLDGPTEIGGLEATGVTTAYDVDGTTDITTRYYAQDAAGNVWVVGADAGGPGRGDWRAGEDGAEAGLVMPAHLRIGDGWIASAVPSLPEASRQVEELSSGMVQMLDEVDTTTRSVYEKGVGLVSIEDLDGGRTTVLVR
ncbi:hypothetical protein [Nocardioides baculatus]|uniref:Uncharacterized protein n=1 Tax=Nocardioides baculatus TaxID=2801337 RepID=A0ABS1LAL2_9ACTN|nr:hypothetical protein [Nocardioides baculatus]MBL0748719.1 hypothetical protein [Nocardioides baculatus]